MSSIVPPKRVINSYRCKPVSQDFSDGWNACREAMLDNLTPAPEKLSVQELYDLRFDWKPKAAAWLRSQADKQEITAHRYPAHAMSYPSWGIFIRRVRLLADELDPFGKAMP